MEDSLDVLAHHGVKGQKWGVRRDLSDRLSNRKAVKDAAKAKAERDKTDDANRTAIANKIRKTGVKSLSDSELSAYNNRINMELNFAQLQARANPPKGAKVWIRNTLKSEADRQIKGFISDYSTVKRKDLQRSLGIKSKDDQEKDAEKAEKKAEKEAKKKKNESE